MDAPPRAAPNPPSDQEHHVDLAKLTLEFKVLHEKAKAGPLTPVEQERWDWLRHRLSTNPAPTGEVPQRATQRTPPGDER